MVIRSGNSFGPTLAPGARLAALTLAAVSCAPSYAQTEGVDALLSSHPDLPSLLSSPTAPEAASVAFFYTNLRGAERAGGAPSPASLTDFLELDGGEFARWSASMSRIVAHGIEVDAANETLIRHGVRGLSSVFRTLPQVLGLDWFTITELTAFGTPPDWLAMAFAQMPADASQATASAVEKAGFERRDVYGVHRWHRSGDSQTDARADALAVTAADPFRIGASDASWLLLSAGRLASSGSAALTEITAASWVGKFPNLGEAKAFRTALAAASDGEVHLVQAYVTNRRFTVGDVAAGHLGPYASLEQRTAYAERFAAREPPMVPRYEAVFLADRQEAAGETVLLGILYQDAADAATASAALPSLFDTYAPVTHRQSLLSAEELESASYVYKASPDGPYAAVIKLYRRIAPTDGRGKPGKIYRLLLQNIQIGDIGPLATVDP